MEQTVKLRLKVVLLNAPIFDAAYLPSPKGRTRATSLSKSRTGNVKTAF